jgi:hypothetical protein
VTGTAVVASLMHSQGHRGTGRGKRLISTAEPPTTQTGQAPSGSGLLCRGLILPFPTTYQPGGRHPGHPGSVCGARAREAASRLRFAASPPHRSCIASHRRTPRHSSSNTAPSDSGPPSATARTQRLDCEQLPQHGKHPTPVRR